MEEQATEKQVKFMEQLGIDCNPGTTKAEARMLIDMKLRANDKEDAEPEVERIYGTAAEDIKKGDVVTKKDNGFHLTPEKQEHNLRQVRYWATELCIKQRGAADWAIVKEIEQYILTGE